MFDLSVIKSCQNFCCTRK